MSIFDILLKPNKDRFAKLTIREMKRLGITDEIEYDTDTFSVRYMRSGQPGVFNLHNAFTEYCAAPRMARWQVMRRFIQSVVNSPVLEEISLKEAMPRFLPRLRPSSYYGVVDLQVEMQNQEPMEWAVMDFADGLKAELIVDHEDAIQTVSQKQLDEWGIDLEQGLAQARENLWKLSNEDFVEMAPGIYRSPWQDCHDTARFYLEDLIWQLKVNGRHVVTMPNRDLMFVCGDGEAEALQKLLEFTLKAYEHERPMIAIPYALEGKLWQQLVLPDDHPGSVPLHQLRLVQHGGDYQQQADLLNHLFEKEGTDIFVATYTVQEDQASGAWESYAVWSEGIDTLLPVADKVVFVRDVGGEGKPLGIVSWKKVMDVVGDLLEPTEYVPVRYRLRQFPSKQQLKDMELVKV